MATNSPAAVKLVGCHHLSAGVQYGSEWYLTPMVDLFLKSCSLVVAMLLRRTVRLAQTEKEGRVTWTWRDRKDDREQLAICCKMGRAEFIFRVVWLDAICFTGWTVGARIKNSKRRGR